QRYSVGVVVATLAVFGIPLAFGADLTDALLRAMTFMIVASPCAVVLATMPPLLSAIANAGRHGVLVKSAVAMERLGEIDTAALDKTGTLTEGTPEVTAVTPAAGAGVDEDALLALAAAAEHPSEHPLARAIVAAARARGLHIAPADDFTAAPGRGVTAVIDGRTVHVGRAEPTEGAAGAAGAETTVRVTRDGTHLGTLALTDRLRDDAARATTRLTALTGTAPTLLTGDHAAAAARVADATGITDVRAGLLPEDKVGAVRERERAGRKVLFVGDGVNDAAALATADLGLAMGTGTDAAIEAGDLTLVRGDLRVAADAIRLSRRTLATIKGNLVWAFGYNVAALPLAAAGLLNPMIAGAAMAFSSVFVVTNSLRLRAFR
ncbi:heavy metal translocating P-type ATPase, partial [Streptomyces violaceoruber]